MMVTDELEAMLQERGVRTAQRQKILRLLMEENGAEKLRRMLEAHENRIRAALDRVREDMA